MNKARAKMLDDVRTSLGRGPSGLEEARRAWRQTRRGGPSRSTPAGEKSPAQCFESRLQAAEGRIARVDERAQIPGAIQAYMQAHGLPERACRADHPLLARLEWPFPVSVFNSPGAAQTDMGISVASAGVAETGSLVMLSGADSPVSLSFLPEHHVVVLETGAIVRDMEALWERLRATADFPPRGVHLITGPSRTADVEQTLQIGAHGPRALLVILLRSAAHRDNPKSL